MNVVFTGEITVDSAIPGVDSDRIGPFTIQVEKTVSVFRQAVTLLNGVWYTPNLEGKTPWLIQIFNTGACPIKVGFGQGEPILIDVAGPPATFTGSQVPSLCASGGNSNVIVFILAV
jgi:hypothetical protein